MHCSQIRSIVISFHMFYVFNEQHHHHHPDSDQDTTIMIFIFFSSRSQWNTLCGLAKMVINKIEQSAK